MKYVEQIKTILLFFLVSLSLILTFTIWSYTPNYQIIEEDQVEEIMVGEAKTWQDVFKPYRLLSHENGYWTGTVKTSIINNIMTNLSSWTATELSFMQSNVSNAKINEMIRTDKRMTLFFEAEVPINVFKSLFANSDLPEVTFKYLILDWSGLAKNQSLQLYFVSEENRTLYNANVSINASNFEATILAAAQKFEDYQEIIRESALSLYVSQLEPDITQYTYIVDEVAPELFSEILFTDPSIVQKNIENLQSEEYKDGMSLMKVDLEKKTINYVYPASESIMGIPASRLVQDSYEFINEHGGLTGDYRYSSINVGRHITEYRLYTEGLPVYGSITSTRISTTWGDKQIFRYYRPYYLLDMDIPAERVSKQLLSGVEVFNLLQKSGMKVSSIDELLLGYYLMQTDKSLYTLAPSWFVIEDGKWLRVTSQLLGGIEYGLE